MDTRKRRKEGLSAHSPLLETLQNSPKRARVHAQRKFAQGSQPTSPALTPVKDGKDKSLQGDLKSKSNKPSATVEPPLRPKTEDFLTFLCFRRTPMLPPNLEYFENPQLIDTTSDFRSLTPPREEKHKPAYRRKDENAMVDRKLIMDAGMTKKNVSDQTDSETVSGGGGLASSARVTRSSASLTPTPSYLSSPPSSETSPQSLSFVLKKKLTRKQLLLKKAAILKSKKKLRVCSGSGKIHLRPKREDGEKSVVGSPLAKRGKLKKVARLKVLEKKDQINRVLRRLGTTIIPKTKGRITRSQSDDVMKIKEEPKSDTEDLESSFESISDDFSFTKKVITKSEDKEAEAASCNTQTVTKKELPKRKLSLQSRKLGTKPLITKFKHETSSRVTRRLLQVKQEIEHLVDKPPKENVCQPRATRSSSDSVVAEEPKSCSRASRSKLRTKSCEESTKKNKTSEDCQDIDHSQRSRPSRKTKQVAEVYLELLSQRLAKESRKTKEGFSDDDMIDEDTISISSIKELKAFSKSASDNKEVDIEKCVQEMSKRHDTFTNKKDLCDSEEGSIIKKRKSTRKLSPLNKNETSPPESICNKKPSSFKPRSNSPRLKKSADENLSFKKRSSGITSPGSLPSSEQNRPSRKNETQDQPCRLRKLSTSPPSTACKFSKGNKSLSPRALPRKRALSDAKIVSPKDKLGRRFSHDLIRTKELDSSPTRRKSVHLITPEESPRARTNINSCNNHKISNKHEDTTRKKHCSASTKQCDNKAAVPCQDPCSSNVINNDCCPVIEGSLRNSCDGKSPSKGLDENVKCLVMSPRSKRTLSLDTCNIGEVGAVTKSKSTMLKKFKSLDNVGLNKNCNSNSSSRSTLVGLHSDSKCVVKGDLKSDSSSDKTSTSSLISVKKSLFGKRRNSVHDAVKLNEVLGCIAKDFQNNMDDSYYDKIEKDLNAGNKSPEKANRAINEHLQSAKKTIKKEIIDLPTSLENQISAKVSSNSLSLSPINVPKKSNGKKLCEVVRNLQEKKRAESPLTFKETDPPVFLKDFKPKKEKKMSSHAQKKDDLSSKKSISGQNKNVSDLKKVTSRNPKKATPKKITAVQKIQDKKDNSVLVKQVSGKANMPSSIGKAPAPCVSVSHSTEIHNNCTPEINAQNETENIGKNVKSNESGQKEPLINELRSSSINNCSLPLETVQPNLLNKTCEAIPIGLPSGTPRPVPFIPMIPLNTESIINVPMSSFNAYKGGALTINPGPISTLRHPVSISLTNNQLSASLMTSRVLTSDSKAVRNDQSAIAKSNFKQVLIAPKPSKSSNSFSSSNIALKPITKPVQIAPKLPCSGTSTTSSMNNLQTNTSLFPGSAIGHVIQGVPQALQTLQAIPQVQPLQAIAQNFTSISGMSSAIPTVMSQPLTAAFNRSHLVTPSSQNLLSQPIFVTSSMQNIVGGPFDITMQNTLQGNVRLLPPNMVGKVSVASKLPGPIMSIHSGIPSLVNQGPISNNVIPSLMPFHPTLQPGSHPQFLTVNMMPVGGSPISLPNSGQLPSSHMGSIICPQTVGVASQPGVVSGTIAPMQGQINLINRSFVPFSDINASNPACMINPSQQPVSSDLMNQPYIQNSSELQVLSQNKNTSIDSNEVNQENRSNVDDQQENLVINDNQDNLDNKDNQDNIDNIDEQDNLDINDSQDNLDNNDKQDTNLDINDEQKNPIINNQLYNPVPINEQENCVPNDEDEVTEYQDNDDSYLDHSGSLEIDDSNEASLQVDESVCDDIECSAGTEETIVEESKSNALNNNTTLPVLKSSVSEIVPQKIFNALEPKMEQCGIKKNNRFGSKFNSVVSSPIVSQALSKLFPIPSDFQEKDTNVFNSDKNSNLSMVDTVSTEPDTIKSPISISIPSQQVISPISHVMLSNFILTTSSLVIPKLGEQSMTSPRAVTKVSQSSPPYVLSTSMKNDYPKKDPLRNSTSENSMPVVNVVAPKSSERLFPAISESCLSKSSDKHTSAVTKLSEIHQSENDAVNSNGIENKNVTASAFSKRFRNDRIVKSFTRNVSQDSNESTDILSNWSPKSFYSSDKMKSTTDVNICSNKTKFANAKTNLNFASSQNEQKGKTGLNSLKKEPVLNNLTNGKDFECGKHLKGSVNSKDGLLKRKTLFKTKYRKEETTSDAFSVVNESSVYAFEPDVDTPLETSSPFFQRIKNIQPIPTVAKGIGTASSVPKISTCKNKSPTTADTTVKNTNHEGLIIPKFEPTATKTFGKKNVITEPKVNESKKLSNKNVQKRKTLNDSSINEVSISISFAAANKLPTIEDSPRKNVTVAHLTPKKNSTAIPMSPRKPNVSCSSNENSSSIKGKKVFSAEKNKATEQIATSKYSPTQGFKETSSQRPNISSETPKKSLDSIKFTSDNHATALNMDKQLSPINKSNTLGSEKEKYVMDRDINSKKKMYGKELTFPKENTNLSQKGMEQKKKSKVQKITKVTISEAYKDSDEGSSIKPTATETSPKAKKNLSESSSIAIQCDLDDSQDDSKGNESATQTEEASKFPLPPSASPFYYLPLAMATLGEKLPAQLVQQMLAKTQGLVGAAEAGLILQQAATLAQQYHKTSDDCEIDPTVPLSPTVKPISPKSGSIALQKALRANLASMAHAEIGLSVAQSSGAAQHSKSVGNNSDSPVKGLLKIAVQEHGNKNSPFSKELTDSIGKKLVDIAKLSGDATTFEVVRNNLQSSIKKSKCITQTETNSPNLIDKQSGIEMTPTSKVMSYVKENDNKTGKNDQSYSKDNNTDKNKQMCDSSVNENLSLASKNQMKRKLQEDANDKENPENVSQNQLINKRNENESKVTNISAKRKMDLQEVNNKKVETLLNKINSEAEHTVGKTKEKPSEDLENGNKFEMTKGSIIRKNETKESNKSSSKDAIKKPSNPVSKTKRARVDEMVKRRSGRSSTLAATRATESDMMEVEELKRNRRAKRAAAVLAKEEGWSSCSEPPMSPVMSPESLRGWPPSRITSPTPSQSSEGTSVSSTPSHRSRMSGPHSRRHSPAGSSDSKRHGGRYGTGSSTSQFDPVIEPGVLNLSDNSNLARAPSFFPSEEEFNEPLEYIEKIRPEAEQFGLCRIVPPSNFRPECRVNDDMRFVVFKQYVQRMTTRWGPSDAMLCAIKRCLLKQNIDLSSPPLIAGLELDLVQFYRVVEEHGGLMNVIEKELWSKVADALRIPRSAQDRVTKLDSLYCKYLLPYTMLSKCERDLLLRDVEEAHRRSLYDSHSKKSSNPLSDTEEDDEEEPIECIVKGKSTALSAFYRLARNVACQWQPDPDGLNLDERYWSVVKNRDCHLCIHVASIDTAEHGYGFPSPKNSPDAKHPWNLKNLVQNPNSILRSMNNCIGVTAPTLHIGMMFSTVCWYKDPHSLPWLEYLHTGASKIWYGVSAAQEDQLRDAMEKLVPDFIKDSPLWLPSDTAMVPPDDLVREGVKVCRVVQEPGQFVVVFPGAFTSSIGSGYTISESAFFARPQYFDRAVMSFKTLMECCEPSMFSLDRLAFSVAEDSKATLDGLIRARILVSDILQREKTDRLELTQLGMMNSERLHAPDRKKKSRYVEEADENTCEICRQHLYVSLVSYEEDDSVFCLQHAIAMIRTSSPQLDKCKLMYTFSLPEMMSALKQLDERIQLKSCSKKSSSVSSKRVRLSDHQQDSFSSTSSSNF